MGWVVLLTSCISALWHLWSNGISPTLHCPWWNKPYEASQVSWPHSGGGAAALHYLCCSMLEVGLQHRMQGYCVATYCSTVVTIWHKRLGNWQGLTKMRWNDRSISSSSITWLKVVPWKCMEYYYSWDHFKSMSARDLVISRDVLWWCEITGEYSWLKMVPWNSVWSTTTHGTILSHCLPKAWYSVGTYSDDVRWQGHTLDLKWSHEMVYGTLLLMGPF